MIIKKLITCFTALLCLTNILAQPWPAYYGQPDRTEYSTDIIEAYDHGYLICGQYSSPDWQHRWAWLIKTDINGEVLWEKLIEGQDMFINPFSIEQAADGGLLVCGRTRIDTITVPFVLKLNACGEKEWCNVFFGSTNIGQTARDIKETESGDIVVLVTMFGSNPEETLHLFKMNTAGDMIWQQAFATTYNHPQSLDKHGSSLLITSDNKYLITGSGYWQHPWNPQGLYGIRGFFVMVDSDGNEEWVLPFGLNDTITSHASYSIELGNKRFLAIADIRSSPQPSSMLIFFDSTGTVTNQVSIPIASIGPGIADGESRRICLVDSVYVISGYYGQSILSTNVTDFLLDTNLMAGINILGHRKHPKTLTSIKTNITHDQKILGITSYRDTPPTYGSLCLQTQPQPGV